MTGEMSTPVMSASGELICLLSAVWAAGRARGQSGDKQRTVCLDPGAVAFKTPRGTQTPFRPLLLPFFLHLLEPHITTPRFLAKVLALISGPPLHNLAPPCPLGLPSPSCHPLAAL